jgi:16S rRNA (guanine(966)-N(2))-methyltransferase RsmD
MRVIAGKAKGRKLRTVPGEGTRPITDRVKEALFNIIGADVVTASFWDLFAGTGSVGIEALSRGAASVRFTEKDPKALKVIRENLRNTQLADCGDVLQADALGLLKKEPNFQFDYVYIAPPQYQELWIQALTSLDGKPGWLSDDAWVIVQIHPREYHPQEFEHLNEFDRRKYGSTMLVFYEQ